MKPEKRIKQVILDLLSYLRSSQFDEEIPVVGVFDVIDFLQFGLIKAEREIKNDERKNNEC